MPSDLFDQDITKGMHDDVKTVYLSVYKHKSKSDAIKELAITTQTGISGRKVRDCIKTLVETFHKPIGSCSHGFFIASTSDEINEVYNNLVSRALSTLKRAKAFKANSRLEEVLGQLQLELNS